MASDDSGERTEEATQQRREDYRKRGQIAQTRELSSVFMLFAGVLLMWIMSRFFFQQIGEVFTHSFGDGLVDSVRSGDWKQIGYFAFIKISYVLAPLLGVFLVLGFLSTVLQTGFIYNEEALQLNWDRLNPVSGAARLFTTKALVDGFKSCVKMVLILALSFYLLRSQIEQLPFLMNYSIGQIFIFLGTVMTRLLSGVGFFMLALAAADYFYQRWELEKEMRMTKQEIKEEHKSREGDPMIKSRMRRIQREMSSKRMMEEVPKADVIVTNPTHIAVALKYSEKMIAPQIVAMGADLVAEKIRKLAREHNIPIVENKPLARAMFKTMKIGQGIPRELYTAVAEVLSYVYKLKRKRRA